MNLKNLKKPNFPQISKISVLNPVNLRKKFMVLSCLLFFGLLILPFDHPRVMCAFVKWF